MCGAYENRFVFFLFLIQFFVDFIRLSVLVVCWYDCCCILCFSFSARVRFRCSSSISITVFISLMQTFYILKNIMHNIVANICAENAIYWNHFVLTNFYAVIHYYWAWSAAYDVASEGGSVNQIYMHVFVLDTYVMQNAVSAPQSRNYLSFDQVNKLSATTKSKSVHTEIDMCSFVWCIEEWTEKKMK